MTFAEALDAAREAGWDVRVHTWDGGHTIRMTKPGQPDFRYSMGWGEEPLAAAAIERALLPEDDPSIQHTAPVIGEGV